MKKANVKKIRFHDLRHSHVALLIDMQEQDFIIKEQMGHASIKITYGVYGHLFLTRQHELANSLEDLL
jgi:Phage integrase family.